MHVAYYAPFAQRTGYAQAAHDYMLALHRAGVSLEIHPLVECDTDNLDERYAELIPLALEVGKKKPTHTIIHTVPKAAPLFAQRAEGVKVVITTWETSFMPLPMQDALERNFDAIVMPSAFCLHTLGPKASSKAHVVPHCFDPAHWPLPTPRPPGGPFSFYSILGWSERKNPIGLLKAYFSEFTSDDDVVLRLKLSGHSQDDIDALIQASGVPVDRLPRLEIISGYDDHEDLVLFHQENDVFVTAARGEGWNLPAFEAALLGKTVISPYWGGQKEFLQHYSSYYGVDGQLTPAVSPPQVAEAIDIAGVRVRPVNQVAPSGIDITQSWCEPDLYGLASAMREHYAEDSFVDLTNRAELESLYSYDTVGKELATLLERTTK